MIDIEYANREFEKFLDEYDRADEKIKLKIVHTRRCCKKCKPDSTGNETFKRRPGPCRAYCTFTRYWKI